MTRKCHVNKGNNAMNIPTVYIENRYYKNNPKYFIELRELVIHYPR